MLFFITYYHHLSVSLSVSNVTSKLLVGSLWKFHWR